MLLALYRFWEVLGGVEGETCSSSGHATEHWCKSVQIFPCVDRTIHCNAIPSFLNNEVTILNEEEEGSLTILGTSIGLTCTGENYYFDFSVPDDLVSFYYSNNVNETTITCNKDS